MPIDTTLTIYSPDLLSQIQANILSGDFSVLARVLSKASEKTQPKSNDDLDKLDHSLANLLSIPETHLRAKAALHLHGTNQQNASWACFANPVKMQPNRDHMVISQPDNFDFTDQEGEALTHELNDYFKEDDIQFVYQTPGYWVCYCVTPHDITHYSPKAVLGENIMQFLPAAKDDVQWRKIFNEAQMLLHHSVTNQQRISQGKNEINSLWFFGGGVLPEKYQSNYSHVFTDNSQLKGLSKLGGATVKPLPSRLSTERFESNTDSLIILDNPDDAMINTYLAEVLDLIEKKRISSFTIIPRHDQAFYLAPKDLKKFWRRTKDISCFF